MTVTYKQESKNKVRHTVIKHAVEILTTFRAEASCVRRSYIRDVYDYYIQLEESHEQDEAKKIDVSYIQEWEHMHTSNMGIKRPDELTVCYLSGPEPENDFMEFISLGVKPQNIWAFESEKNTYLQALNSIDGTDFMQPKIIKTSIERFFETTPKTFDIVYVDACATLISDQHALRSITTLFRYHRLNSPGVLISNFAYFDEAILSEKQQYIDAIARYNFIRNNRNAFLLEEKEGVRFSNGFEKEKERVEESLQLSYGDFISAMICNSASISVPTLRFCNSNYLQSLSKTKPIVNQQYTFQKVNSIKDNTLCKYLAMNRFLNQKGTRYYEGNVKIEKLSDELSAQYGGYDLLSSAQKLYSIRMENQDVCTELDNTLAFFERGNSMYQFLDKPNRILFFDAVINQISYPMHYVSDKVQRLTYVAKQTRMFTDLILFDECRYIYDWLPAIHQIPNAFSNPSWQYTFRFALDGLIKQRIKYNNEFFFQGSVISKEIKGFEEKQMPDRVRIN